MESQTQTKAKMSAARAEVQRVRDFMEYSGRVVLQTARDLLTPGQVESLHLGMRKIFGPFDKLMSFGDPNVICAARGDVADLFESVAELMQGAFLIGALTTRNVAAEKILQVDQAARAREARAQTPKEVALRAAIEAERDAGPVRKPTKEAGRILSPVNYRLQEAGFDPVKVDVIRRRLEKLPRS